MTSLLEKDDACAIDLGRGRVAWVDRSDFERVSGLRWHVKPNRKASYVRSGKTLMHRFILDAPAGSVVDHIDGDGLNNRRSNIRLCSIQQNSWNRTAVSKHGFKGVCFKPKNKIKPWQAIIKAHGKRKDLGHFSSKEEAARAYDAEASRIYGEFANLNFPVLSSVQPVSGSREQRGNEEG